MSDRIVVLHKVTPVTSLPSVMAGPVLLLLILKLYTLNIQNFRSFASFIILVFTADSCFLPMMFFQTGIWSRISLTTLNCSKTPAWEKMCVGTGWWRLGSYLKLIAWGRHLWTARATRKGLGPLSEDSMQEEKQISQCGDCPGACWARRRKDLSFKTKHKGLPVVWAGGKAASFSRGIPLCELKPVTSPGITVPREAKEFQ